ncbi:MAG: hypothetical protein FWH52_04565 [Synergistaceae bacterium]|nr:hypothetical protein [Synergistaceae bacterium]
MPEEELLNNELSSKEYTSINDEAQSSQEESQSSEEGSGPISQEEELSYVAIKGVFYTPKADNAGVFCIIYRGETGKVIFRELWAIRSNKEPISSISDRWEDFIREMNKIGTYDKDSSGKLMPVVEKSLSSNIKEYLYKNIDDTEFVYTEIRKALENSLHYLVEVRIEAEIFGESRAESGGLLRDKESSSDKNQKEDFRDLMGIINLGGVPLMCEPVIDPVNGCPVSKISIGDFVHVSIKETNNIAKKVIDHVRAEGKPLSFPVTLVQELESGKCVVIMKISDEISGVLNLQKEIMLKTDALQRTQVNPFAKFFNSTNLFLGGMLLLIAFLLYLVARFI